MRKHVVHMLDRDPFFGFTTPLKTLCNRTVKSRKFKVVRDEWKYVSCIDCFQKATDAQKAERYAYVKGLIDSLQTVMIAVDEFDTLKYP